MHKKKRFLFSFLTLLTLVFNSCMTMEEGVAIGQIAAEDQAYLVGQVNITIPEDQKTSEKYEYITLYLESNNQGSVGDVESFQVPMNKPFYVDVPKGKYRMRVISYITNRISTGGEYDHGALGIMNNIFTEEISLDLENVQMAYIGDIVLERSKNPYGFYQLQPRIENRFDAILTETEGWLLDSSGKSVQPLDMTSLLDTGYYLNDPYTIKLTNLKFDYSKDQVLRTLEDEAFSIDPSKSIAFLSADNNRAGWNIARLMDDYAQSVYNAKVLTQKDIEAVLPLYPAEMYSLNSEKGPFDIMYEKEYDTRFDALFTQVGEMLDVDYLYVFYKVIGTKTDEKTIHLQLRSRVFDVRSGKALAQSTYLEDEALAGIMSLMMNGPDFNTGMELSTALAEKCIDSLYD